MRQKRLLAGIAIPLLFLLSLSTSSFAQNKIITGKVTDSKDGSPIQGVSVIPKGSQRGTVTGADGTFSIPVKNKTTVLVFSYVGFGRLEQTISGNSLVVSLTAINTSLNEVVVIGYGTVRKKDLTGSVATVTSKDFNPGAVATPEQLIQGKVAGVNITTNGGAPGAGSTIRIRNGASLNASNDPLLVIDGVPLDNGTINGSANPLDMINPNDIESFSVLKDASATAIYGSRASNGVIIITTKKGRLNDRFHLNFSTLLSDQTPAAYNKVLNAAQFTQAVSQYNSSYTNLLGNSNTNWQKQIYQDAVGTDNTLSLYGGIKWLPYRLSLGYTGDNGILKTGYMDRESAALNLNPVFFNNSLKVDVNVKGAITQNRFANTSAVGSADAMDPTQPVFSGKNNLDGYWEWVGSDGKPLTLAPKNPLGQLYETQDKSNVKRSIGNIQLDYTFPFLPALRANLNTGYDVSRSNGTYYQDSTGASGYFGGGDTRKYTQKITNKVLDFYLYYGKDFKSINSHFDITGGYTYQDVLRQAPAAPDSNLTKTVQLSAGPADSTELTLISFWGRMNYSYKGKYLLTATLRDDGSSRFSPSNRWGLFPSVALGWNMKEESFLRNGNTLSALKLRLSYGITGNQDIGSYYPYLATYTLSTSTAQYGFGNNFYPTWRPNGYDANIKWEQQTTYNIGLDYGFLKNRINGSIDVYQKNTSNLLSSVTLPQGSNFSNVVTTNVGSMKNKGIEIGINATPVITNKFTWDLGFNITYSTTKITNLSLPGDTIGTQNIAHGGISGGTGTNVQVYQQGYDPNQFYLYRQVYGSNGAPLEGVYVDLKRTGTPGLDYYKTATPKVFLGFNSQFKYQRWSLGFSLRAEFGNYVYNNIASNSYYSGMANGQGFLANASTAILKDNFVSGEYLSNYFLENASFLKMDNARLSYDFGKSISKNVSVRASLAVQNVFTITKYTGLDPEVSGGIDNNLYPRPRIISFGVNLGF